MPHPIVEIDELVRLVIDYLVEISPRSAVSFALTCRSLEEPTLSALWRQQQRLLIPLLRVLPQFTEEGNVYIVSGCNFPLGYNPYRFSQIAGNPRPKDWDRLRLFASWMRRLSLDSRVNDVHDIALQRLSSELPGEVLCPNLGRLDWEIGTLRTPHSFHIFLSPSLKHVSLSTDFVPNRLQYAGEIVSHLPSFLEHFFLTCGPWKDGEPLKDLMSPFVL